MLCAALPAKGATLFVVQWKRIGAKLPTYLRQVARQVGFHVPDVKER